MADKITQYWPLFVGSKKIAEAHEQTYDISPNKGLLFDADGFAGISIGAAHAQIQVSSIDPVGGSSIDLIAMALNQGIVGVGVLQPDRTYKVHSMTVSNVQKKTSSETGRSDASFTFIGGPPKTI